MYTLEDSTWNRGTKWLWKIFLFTGTPVFSGLHDVHLPGVYILPGYIYPYLHEVFGGGKVSGTKRPDHSFFFVGEFPLEKNRGGKPI